VGCVDAFELRVVEGCAFGEEFGVVHVGRGRGVLAVGEGFGEDIDVVEGDFAFMRDAEVDDALDAAVDGLVQTDHHVVAGLPLEAALAGDDVAGVDLLFAVHLETGWGEEYPRRRPAESLVFCVEEACILEAK
jgi:hypothetical protein